MTQLTKNTQRTDIAYVEDGGALKNNVQAVCEALGGSAAGEGQATWAAAATLTVTDSRVISTSKIVLSASGALPIGLWSVTTKSSGSFVITSSEVEEAGTLVDYIVVNI